MGKAWSLLDNFNYSDAIGAVTEDTFQSSETGDSNTTIRIMQFKKTSPAVFRIQRHSNYLAFTVLQSDGAILSNPAAYDAATDKIDRHPLCDLAAPGDMWSDAFDNPDTSELTLTYGNQIVHTAIFKPCHEYRAFFENNSQKQSRFSDVQDTFFHFATLPDTGKTIEDSFRSSLTNEPFEYVSKKQPDKFDFAHIMQFEKTPPAALRLVMYSDYFAFIVLEPQ